MVSGLEAVNPSSVIDTFFHYSYWAVNQSCRRLVALNKTTPQQRPVQTHISY